MTSTHASGVGAGRRRAAALLGAFVLGSLVTGGAVIGYQAARPAEQREAQYDPVLVTVEKRPLNDAIHLTCTVRRSTQQLPLPQTDGVAVVTAPPPRQPVPAGGLVAEVNDQPLFFLSGQFPLFRDLNLGDKGRDVRMIQEGLRSVDSKVRVSGVVDQNTMAAVQRLYTSAGYSAPKILRASDLVVAPVTSLTLVSAPQVGLLGEKPLGTYESGRPTVACTSPRLDELLPGADVTQTEIQGLTVGELVVPTAEEGALPEEPSVSLNLPERITQPLPQGGFEADVIVARTSGDALVVPSGALGGTPASPILTVWRDGSGREVPVETGVQSAGFVAVSPPLPGDLQAGDQVVVPG